MSETLRTFPSAVTAVPADDPFATALAANWAMGRRNARQPVIVYSDSTHAAMAIPPLQELLSSPRVTAALWGAPLVSPSAVLALSPSSTHLDALTSDQNAVAVCVVPADLDDVAAWAINTRAARLGTAATLLPDSDGRLQDDPILQHAMRTLDLQISAGGGLAAGPDRDAATGMLTLVHDSGHWAAPDDFFAWAIVSGWPIRSARRLRTIAAVIASGAQVEPMAGSIGHSLLTTWRRRRPTSDPGDAAFDVPPDATEADVP